MDLSSIIQQISILALPLLLAVTFHEVAHGWVASKLGDDTAKMAGRLSLNPLKHLDFWGTIAFLLTRMIGWAKPVPVNYLNLKNPKRDMAWVALAGPLTNILLALLCAALYRILLSFVSSPLNSGLLSSILIPVFLMSQMGVVLNLGLAIFNILPIPPLDGSRILAGILPPQKYETFSKLEPYGFLILILLIATRGVDLFIYPLIRFGVGLFLGH